MIFFKICDHFGSPVGSIESPEQRDSPGCIFALGWHVEYAEEFPDIACITYSYEARRMGLLSGDDGSLSSKELFAFTEGHRAIDRLYYRRKEIAKA
jgi:hypothetical protein